MDPITLIVAALAAGASAGISRSASRAVQDAYAGLRDAVRRRLTNTLGSEVGQAAIQTYEADPATAAPQLERILKAADGGEDADLVAAAQRLLELVDPDGSAASKYDLRGATGVMIGGQGHSQHNQSVQTNHYHNG